MKTETAKELLIGGLATQFDVSAYDDEFLVTTPFAFEDGTVVEVRATFNNDQVLINDDGYIAQELEQMGLDVLPQRKTNASRAWESIKKNLPFAPALGSHAWELAVSAEIHHFGTAVTAVAEAAVRAEALKVLAPTYTPRSFSDRIIKFLSSSRPSLHITPKARLPLHSGGFREVSFSATNRRELFVQSATSENRNASFDKAVGVFTATPIDRSRRLVAIEGQLSDWENWHIEGINQVAPVVESYDFDKFADRVVQLAA